MKNLEELAFALANAQPEHLGKRTIPPISWRQEGNILTVIMADGRKVSASIQEINELMFAPELVELPPTEENKKVAKILGVPSEQVHTFDLVENPSTKKGDNPSPLHLPPAAAPVIPPAKPPAKKKTGK